MIILDGGMGQELVKRAGRATDNWSMQSMLDAPEMVRAVHDEYFAAGAQVATTNTYMLLPDRMAPKGLGDRIEDLNRSACAMAVAARDAHGSGMVAGSLGPQGFSYQPDLCPPADQAAADYAPLAAIHAEYVDVHILETMASVDQARGGLMGTAGTGLPVWLSLTVDDADGTRLRSGEPLADILPLVAEFGPEAVLLNCSLPEVISDGLPILAAAGLRCGAYANGFTGIHKDFNSIHATAELLAARQDLGPAEYLEFAQGWADAGAGIVGGCCEVGPGHIAALAKAFGDV